MDNHYYILHRHEFVGDKLKTDTIGLFSKREKAVDYIFEQKSASNIKWSIEGIDVID